MDGSDRDRCLMYDVDYAEILRQNITQADPKWSRRKCSRWEFNYTDVPYPTIATEVYNI